MGAPAGQQNLEAQFFSMSCGYFLISISKKKGGSDPPFLYLLLVITEHRR